MPNEGNTPTERYLAQLGKHSFLSLWNYPNPFTDEGKKHDKGDGKELCDLLVVFGQHVLIFSDKCCHFSGHQDLKVAWGRWYKSAVEKSAKQLCGARHWILRYPERIFTDRQCTKKIPIPFPQKEDIRFHLIAVTGGSCEPCKSYFGSESAGGLALDTRISESEHYDHPFTIGHVIKNGPYIHVFDPLILDILMKELDTITDLVEYLEKKECFLTQKKPIMAKGGEQQLVVEYLSDIDEKTDKHIFPAIPPDFDGITFIKNQWKNFNQYPRYQAKKEADRISYIWDQLIEDFVKQSQPEHERGLRVMAAEPRLARRLLGRQFFEAASQQMQPFESFSRHFWSTISPSIGYVFLIFPCPPNITDNNLYCQLRGAYLYARCKVLKLNVMPNATEIIGIASGHASEKYTSYGLCYLDCQNWGSTDEEEAKELQHKLGIWKNDHTKKTVIECSEYPD